MINGVEQSFKNLLSVMTTLKKTKVMESYGQLGNEIYNIKMIRTAPDILKCEIQEVKNKKVLKYLKEKKSNGK